MGKGKIKDVTYKVVVVVLIEERHRNQSRSLRHLCRNMLEKKLGKVRALDKKNSKEMHIENPGRFLILIRIYVVNNWYAYS